MIRKLLNGDIDRIADIWLKTNLKAHYFISNQYWKSNYELVKEMMSQYEVYVFEADKMIQGFVGLNDKYIEGIFVSDEMQSCGIGKLLLDYVKDKKVSLRLNVYQKNARAISFYQREGFIIQYEGLDEARKAEQCPRDHLLLRYGSETPDGYRLPCKVPHILREGGGHQQHDQDHQEESLWLQGYRVLLPKDQIHFYERLL